jgi:hypothetical protein
MKSPMIDESSYIKDKENYSELQVMHSAAGYYIGTIYNGEYGEEPGSRDSDYFKTEKDAELFLEELERDNLVCIKSLRDHP